MGAMLNYTNLTQEAALPTNSLSQSEGPNVKST